MKEVIAMHGWGSDSSFWGQWENFFSKHHWEWQSGERGYGKLPLHIPSWQSLDKESNNDQRVVIAHSLGPHLLNREIHANSTHLVLLASFSSFVPKGSNQRVLLKALQGMQNLLGTDREKKMLTDFLVKASYPESYLSLPKGPLHGDLSKKGRERLKADLALLIDTNGLPNGLTTRAKVLVINAEEDAIVIPEAKKSLLAQLITQQENPPIEWQLKGIGHTLNTSGIIEKVHNWLVLSK